MSAARRPPVQPAAPPQANGPLREYRCRCGKLLVRSRGSTDEVEVVCGRCKRRQFIHLGEYRREREGADQEPCEGG